jgi:hypothetical protein
VFDVELSYFWNLYLISIETCDFNFTHSFTTCNWNNYLWLFVTILRTDVARIIDTSLNLSYVDIWGTFYYFFFIINVLSLINNTNLSVLLSASFIWSDFCRLVPLKLCCYVALDISTSYPLIKFTNQRLFFIPVLLWRSRFTLWHTITQWKTYWNKK